jgi:hypothetical protein
VNPQPAFHFFSVLAEGAKVSMTTLACFRKPGFPGLRNKSNKTLGLQGIVLGRNGSRCQEERAWREHPGSVTREDVYACGGRRCLRSGLGGVWGATVVAVYVFIANCFHCFSLY